MLARENGIEGKVFISFVIEKDGSITDVKVKRSVGGGLDEELVRVIKSMPNWSPARQNGKPVRVQFSLPVVFDLE